MWIFILKYWKIILPVFAVMLLLSALWAYGATKYRQGHKDATYACNIEKQAAKEKALERGLEIDRLQKTVIRPDDAAYIDILRRGDL